MEWKTGSKMQPERGPAAGSTWGHAAGRPSNSGSAQPPTSLSSGVGSAADFCRGWEPGLGVGVEIQEPRPQPPHRDTAKGMRLPSAPHLGVVLSRSLPSLSLRPWSPEGGIRGEQAYEAPTTQQGLSKGYSLCSCRNGLELDVRQRLARYLQCSSWRSITI